MHEKNRHDSPGPVKEKPGAPEPHRDEKTRHADGEAAKAGDGAEGKAKKTLAGQAKRAHEVEEKIAELKRELADIQDKYMRSLAEADNFRKRVAREKEEFQKYVLADFLRQLLAVYDNLERALAARGAGSEAAVISGVEITFKQLAELMKSFQVQEIDALDRPFDPERHAALAKEERDDVDEPRVIEVYQKGFLYHNRLLRPALTKVAVPKSDAAPAAAPSADEDDGDEGSEIPAE